MPPVYSTRFLVAGYASGAYTYYVPSGKRAVLRYLTFLNRRSSEGRAIFYVNGLPVWEPRQPAGQSGLDRDCRLVLYAGEQLQVLIMDVDVSAQAHGYLFDDFAQASAMETQFSKFTSEPTPLLEGYELE